LRRASIALAAVLGVLACGSGSAWTPSPRQAGEAPPALLDGVVFEGFRGGAREVQIRAHTAQVDWSREEVALERVSILLTATEDAGEGPVEVQAQRGRIDLTTEAFVLDGGVVAKTADGDRMETARLVYEPNRQVLVSRDPVRVIGERLRIDASGLELDVRTRRVRLLGPVRATTEPG
jgi:LPS export ABC transporter protein LptC